MESSKMKHPKINLMVKGISVILFILSFYLNENTIGSIIQAFAISFLFVSIGIKVEEQGIDKDIKKSFKEYLVPYFLVSLFLLCFQANKGLDNEETNKILMNGLNNIAICLSNPSYLLPKYQSIFMVWVLPLLFLSQNIYIGFFKQIKETKLRLIIISGLFTLGILLRLGLNTSLPWSLDVSLISLLFIELGRWIQTKRIYYFLFNLKIATIFNWLGDKAITFLSFFAIEQYFISNLFPYTHSVFLWTEYVLHFIFLSLLIFFLDSISDYLQNKFIKLNYKHPINTNRMEWPDIAKGLAMLAVILGHLGASYFDFFVYSWHLPLFFIISGYFFKKDSDIKRFIKNKFIRLIVPYYITCIVIIVMSACIAFLKGEETLQIIKIWIAASLYGVGSDVLPLLINVHRIGAIWFLWAMFISLVVMNIILKLKYSYVFVIILTIFGWFWVKSTNILFPLSIQPALFILGFIYFGYLFKMLNVDLYKIPFSIVFLLLLVSMFGLQNGARISAVRGTMNNEWIDYFVAICISVLVILLSIQVSKKSYFFKHLFIYIGRNSLLILSLHIIELNIYPISLAIQRVLGGIYFAKPSLFLYIVCFIVETLILLIVSYVLNKIRMIRKIYAG